MNYGDSYRVMRASQQSKRAGQAPALHIAADQEPCSNLCGMAVQSRPPAVNSKTQRINQV